MRETFHPELTLQHYLWDSAQGHVFTVLDGASIPGLLERLAQETVEHVCLYRGDLAPDLAETAPYVVRLEPGSPFTSWILKEGWGNHWGIFALADAELRTMRRHFRTFLMVYSPEGKPLYFRYYDPRVLRVFLPTCNQAELKTLFGPISSYVVEGEAPERVLHFSQGPKELVRIETDMARPGSEANGFFANTNGLNTRPIFQERN